MYAERERARARERESGRGRELCISGAVHRIIRAEKRSMRRSRTGSKSSYKKKNGMQEHADAAEVQQEACAALINLARGNEVTREVIRAAGAEELARAGLIEP